MIYIHEWWNILFFIKTRMYRQINQLYILDLLDKLWVKYQSLWNETIWIIMDGKLTDGWKGNVRDNYIHDFSGKWRANGPPFSFVKKYFNLTSHETFKRFETHFNIKNELKRPKNKWSPKQKKNMSTSSYSRTRLIQ